VAQDRPRRDPYERRTIWVFALAVFTLILPSYQLTLFGGPALLLANISVIALDAIGQSDF